MDEIQNANPVVYNINNKIVINLNDPIFDDDSIDEITTVEVFEYIRNLNDPEHPLTLEQLNVVRTQHIYLNNEESTVLVQFTPTIPHCSMATLIGLCIRVKLLRSLPSRYKITVQIYPGSHQSEAAVNKQLNDKERVAAAIENGHLLDVVNKCIANTDKF